MKSFYRLSPNEKTEFLNKMEQFLKIRNNLVVCRNKASMATFGREPYPKILTDFEKYSHSNWRWYFETLKKENFDKEEPLWKQAMYPYKGFK